jgi:hypothetical protein
MRVINFPAAMVSTAPWAVHVWCEGIDGDQDAVGTAEFRTRYAAMRSARVTLSHLRDRLGADERDDAIRCCVAQVTGPGMRRTAYLFSTWEPIEWDPCTRLTDLTQRLRMWCIRKRCTRG